MKKSIAIWGSYNHGNYGDDIMAIMISDFVKKLGHQPIVYRLNKELAKKYRIDTSFNISELIQITTLCLIGGGGMLVSEGLLRILLRKNTRNFESDFIFFLKTLRSQNKTSYGISIGGDGKGIKANIPYWRRKFFKSIYFKAATVRLQSDLEVSKKLSFDSIYYPDILLSIPRFFKVNKKKNNYSDNYKIGINLIEKDSGRLVREVINRFSDSDIDFYFINSHLPAYNFQYEIKAPKNIKNFHDYQYTDPYKLVNFISNLDLLISSKLHLGVTSLSVGVPFLSFKGKNKTRTFLNEIKANFALCREYGQVIESIHNPDEIKSKYDWELIKNFSTRSYSHFKFIEKIINENSSNS